MFKRIIVKKLACQWTVTWRRQR